MSMALLKKLIRLLKCQTQPNIHQNKHQRLQFVTDMFAEYEVDTGEMDQLLPSRNAMIQKAAKCMQDYETSLDCEGGLRPKWDGSERDKTQQIIAAQ